MSIQKRKKYNVEQGGGGRSLIYVESTVQCCDVEQGDGHL